MFEQLPPETDALHRLRRERKIAAIIFALFLAIAAIIAILGAVLRTA
jgi:type IV secretory pathway component VirB8